MDSKNNPKFAIFVHELPVECKRDALALFPPKYIENVIHSAVDLVGLQIYFKEYEYALESICQRTIEVRGVPYGIYPLLTDLTVHGIRCYATKSTIRNFMESFGFVFDLYPIEIIKREGRNQTTSLTDDYRVVLGVPEILANFTLSPLWLPELIDCIFPVSFFCRLCRQNGHKQYQCRSPPQQFGGHQKTSAEAKPSDRTMNQAPNSSTGHRNIITPDMSIAISSTRNESLLKYPLRVKEKRDFPHNSSSQGESAKRPIQDSVCSKQGHSQRKRGCRDRTYNRDQRVRHDNLLTVKRENVSEQQRCVCVRSSEKKDTLAQELGEGNVHGGKEKFISEEHGIGMKCPANEDRGKELTSKQTCGKFLSPLIPPEMNFETTCRHIDIIFNCRNKIIPQDVEIELQRLLDWNRSRNKEELGKRHKRFLRLLQLYMAKVNSGQNTVAGRPENSKPQHEDTTGNQQPPKKEKQPPKRQARLSLSPGILEAVSKATGPLTSTLLRNFLIQVRGRKKKAEIAAIFTTNTPDLVKQLREVVKYYYLYGERGAVEDKDIEFIRSLCKKLTEEYRAERPARTGSESDCFFTEKSDLRMNLSQNSLVTGTTSFAKQSSSDEESLERFKCDFQRNASFDSQPRQNFNAIKRSSSEKYPPCTSQISSYDSQSTSDLSATRQFSTGEDLPKNNERDHRMNLSRDSPLIERSNSARQPDANMKPLVTVEEYLPFYGQTTPISTSRSRENPSGKCQTDSRNIVSSASQSTDRTQFEEPTLSFSYIKTEIVEEID